VRKNEYVKYLWMISDLGETEATSSLPEIYQSGDMIKKDEMELIRPFGVFVEGIDYQQADRFE